MATNLTLRDGFKTQDSDNVILAKGELAFGLDHSKFKIGDGKSRWTDLKYFGTTDLSVTLKALNEAINKALGDLIDGSPEALNTLKEISDYLTNLKTKTDALDAEIDGILNTLDQTLTSLLNNNSSLFSNKLNAYTSQKISQDTPPLIAAQISNANPQISSAAAEYALNGEGSLLRRAPGVSSILGYPGQLIVSLGTSITAGFQANIGDVYNRSFVYLSVVRDLGATLDNQGVDSSGIVWDGVRARSLGATRSELTAAGFDPDQSYETKVLGKNADFYLLDIGYNDRDRVIGSIDDTAPSTFYGAYNRVLGALLSEKPNAQIGLVTPPSLYAPVSGGFNSGTDAIRTAILAIGNKYAIPVLDMSKLAQINKAQASTFLPDGVHPSVESHERMSKILTSFIRDVLPIKAPEIQVPGLRYLWRADKIVGNEGSLLQNWQSSVGGSVLTQGDTGKRPMLHVESGVQMIRFDGLNDEFLPNSDLNFNYLHTVSLVARVYAPAGTGQAIANFGTGALQRGTSSNEITDQLVALGGGSGASNTAVAVNPSGGQFHVITMALGLDQSGNNLRQVTIDKTSSSLNGDASPTTIRPGFGIGIYGAVDILSILSSEFALNESQRLDLRNKVKAMYPNGFVA